MTNKPSVDTPVVHVLLATYNGAEWLDEQLDSILGQTGIEVRLFVLDDMSTDGTLEVLARRATLDPRMAMLPPQGSSGGAAPNFYRMLRMVEVPDNAYLSFADQDDIWYRDKLARHVGILRDGAYDAVSSSVQAFAPNGKRTLIRKNYPQRKYDYLTESPGPGSTFVLTPRLARLVVDQLNDPESPASRADFHDSIVYAIGRGRGWAWHIDGEPSLDYRQHGRNVMGSNTGIDPALARLRLIRDHWHRGQAIIHARTALRVTPPAGRVGLERMLTLLEGRGIRNRWALARHARQMRRRPRDQSIIAVLIAIGVW